MLNKTKEKVIIMATKIINIKCPFCGDEKISKNGYNKTGKQVYNCKNSECTHRKFVEDYTYKACNPDIREQVLKMSVNGNGTRATGRTLDISKDRVTSI
jgi:transposase-like protein